MDLCFRVSSQQGMEEPPLHLDTSANFIGLSSVPPGPGALDSSLEEAPDLHCGNVQHNRGEQHGCLE